jgi:hypothetical protein
MEEVYGLTNFDSGVKNCQVYWSLTMTTHAIPFLYFTGALHIRPELLFFCGTCVFALSSRTLFWHNQFEKSTFKNKIWTRLVV